LRIYEILVDRFSAGNPSIDSRFSFETSKTFLGGTLQGITKKLDYIKHLGMDSIWLTPIYRSSAYHGYSVVDYFEVDPHFGSMSDFKRLVDKSHELGLKVILDFVANHLSSEHPFFKAAQKAKSSEYFDWFIFKTWPQEYECFQDSRGLPKLNLENKEARNYILEAARFWIKEFGVDGYRLDYAVGPPMSFWKEFSHTCSNLRSDFILLPEIWLTGMKSKYLENLWFVKNDLTNKKRLGQILSKYDSAQAGTQYGASDAQGEELALKIFAPITDSFLDFPGNFELRKMVTHRTLETQNAYFKSIKNEGSRKSVRRRFQFLDNHDMQRVMWLCKNDRARLTKFLKFLSTFDDIVIYYGTEIGLSQKQDFGKLSSYADREARRFMKWKLDNEEQKLLHTFRSLFSN
jgi:glycosidase